MTNLTNAMNKQDKFYEQFKEAAGQTEQPRFPGFEDVWQQVENRLDKEAQPKIVAFNYKKWLAIAASFLLIILAGVAVYQNNKKEATSNSN
jgi:Ca-activated chloride channel homolog